MTNEELNTALYKKVFAEQEQYREWLLSQPPNEILNHCYEYTVREDIVLALEECTCRSRCGMKLHHGIFQQVFHIAAENTGQLVKDVCLRLVNAIDPLFVHLNVAQIHAGLLCKLCLR